MKANNESESRGNFAIDYGVKPSCSQVISSHLSLLTIPLFYLPNLLLGRSVHLTNHYFAQHRGRHARPKRLREDAGDEGSQAGDHRYVRDCVTISVMS